MSEQSSIEWTDSSWNPVTGCSKVSPGCAHCYAETLTRRFRPDSKPWTPDNAGVNVVPHPERLDAPLRWTRPRRVFVNSMSDIFHEQVPFEFIDRVFAVMALSGSRRQRCAAGTRCRHDDESHGCWTHGEGREEPVHQFQILTKRPQRMLTYLTGQYRRARIEEALNDPEWSVRYDDVEEIAYAAGWPLRNVWLGVSVENQHWANERIPLLLRTPAAVRFLSCEPLLGPLDLGGMLAGIDWVIVGGESGPRHRPMDLAWLTSLVESSRAAKVPVFVKQDGGARPGMQGRIPDELWLKEWPDGR